MAGTPPPVVPRAVNVAQATSDDVPAGAQLRAQSGALQLRDFDRAGRAWQETYGTMRTRRASEQEWLARLQWFKARSKRFWLDHPLLPGSGLPINGNGRENLVRDAAMDADSDSDGVVDAFSSASSGSGWTFSLNGTDGAQEITADGTGASGDSARVEQVILRVFPDDQVTGSFDARLASPTDLEGQVRIAWRDENGNAVGSVQSASFTATSYGRRVVTATAPDGAAFAVLQARATLTAGSGSGDARFRDSRLLRASSDPSSWTNPHVSGGSQTGDTLDTAGWPADTRVLEAGDVFRVGGSGETKAAAETDEVVTSFKVLAPVDSDANGAGTVPIDPPIFAGNAPPDGAALRFEKMRLRAGIVPSRSNLRRPSSLVDKFQGIQATYVEGL